VANIQREVKRSTSYAERSMIATGTMAALEKGTRPEPPENLKETEAKVWKSVVDSMPPDWFSAATFPLLGLYCRHVAGLDFIDRMLDELENQKPPNLKEWKEMSSVRRRECKMIYTLAVKMRLAQQSSYDSQSVRPQKQAAAKVAAAEAVKRPWG
jgi:hypothetical protein